jgi:hypothetical protein
MLGDVAQPALVGSISGEAALDQVSWTGVTQEAPHRQGVWWGAAASRWAWGDDAMSRTVSVRSPGRTGYPRGNRWHVGTTDLGRLARRITRNGKIRYPVGPGGRPGTRSAAALERATFSTLSAMVVWRRGHLEVSVATAAGSPSRLRFGCALRPRASQVGYSRVLWNDVTSLQ